MSQAGVTIAIGDEQVVTRRGTIIPQALHFDEGRAFVSYHTGPDAHFAPTGASFSTDGGVTWEDAESPLQRVTAMGQTGPRAAILFNEYLFRTGEGEYAAYYCTTEDGGVNFSQPKLARFRAKGLVDNPYDPVPTGFDVAPGLDIPEDYNEVVAVHGAVFGGIVFGKILALPNGELLMSAYANLQGGMVRDNRRPLIPEDREDQIKALYSAICFRSVDGGANWELMSVIASPEEGHPFDAGISYSEGFTETGLAQTSDGRLMALMRHGHYMLMWSSFSDDGGKHWSRPQMFPHAGVAPTFCPFGSGSLAVAWGRPGLHVGFSIDGSGKCFDHTIEFGTSLEKSQSYLWPVATEEGGLRVYYDTSSKGENRICYRDIGFG